MPTEAQRAALRTGCVQPALVCLHGARRLGAQALPGQPNAVHPAVSCLQRPHAGRWRSQWPGGKFLFDTGTGFPFLFNNHFLALAKDTLVGRGQAGSGQERVLYTQDAPLASVALGQLVRLENLPAPLHTDWDFQAIST